jgi:hypothetical protein
MGAWSAQWWLMLLSALWVSMWLKHKRVAEGVSPGEMSLQWTGQFEEYAALKRLMAVMPPYWR